MFNASIYAKEFWPRSVDEGWGDAEISLRGSANSNYGTTGNCGVAMLQNISGSLDVITRLRDIIPKQFLPDYIASDFGEATKDYHAMDKALKKAMYKATQNEFFEEVLSQARNTDKHCIIMSDGINKHHKVRGVTGSHGDYNRPTTCWFARELIRRKVGYVVQSPIAISPLHVHQGDFGLTRVWIWFPEGAWAFKPDKFLGHGKIGTMDSAIKKLQNHGNFRDLKLSKDQAREYLESYKIPE